MLSVNILTTANRRSACWTRRSTPPRPTAGRGGYEKWLAGYLSEREEICRLASWLRQFTCYTDAKCTWATG